MGASLHSDICSEPFSPSAKPGHPHALDCKDLLQVRVCTIMTLCIKEETVQMQGRACTERLENGSEYLLATAIPPSWAAGRRSDFETL